MYKLETSNRCHLFEIISEYVWDAIVENHKMSVDKAEIGITKDIVALIRRHHSTNQNFGIWSNEAIDEDQYGSDIDVFVETEMNHFLWYALQAKVLKQDGKYERLLAKRQWEKLSVLQNLSGCIPFFLFYNGVDKHIGTFKDCCLRNVSEKQLGCAIVAIDHVEQMALTKSRAGYSDFYPKRTHPWRELVCCASRRKNGTLYLLTEVKNAVSLYEGILNEKIIEIGSNNQRPPLDRSTITEANNESGRSPDYKIVIRSTAGLMQK